MEGSNEPNNPPVCEPSIGLHSIVKTIEKGEHNEQTITQQENKQKLTLKTILCSISGSQKLVRNGRLQ